ncbi:MAG TPA: hypothetical protein VGF86_12635 [Candidatus Tumulicola sp.]|jgi:hypothetical protein
MADIDPDAVLEIAGYVFKMWVVLVLLGLPSQALLWLAFRSGQRSRRVAGVLAAAAAALAAALVADVVYYRYDGTLSHTVVLWVTLAVFSLPANLLIFLAIFRIKRILPRLSALFGGAALTMLGVAAFGVRTFGYGLQHSLGGWP